MVLIVMALFIDGLIVMTLFVELINNKSENYLKEKRCNLFVIIGLPEILNYRIIFDDNAMIRVGTCLIIFYSTITHGLHNLHII